MPTLIDPSTIYSGKLYAEASYSGTGGGASASWGTLGTASSDPATGTAVDGNTPADFVGGTEYLQNSNNVTAVFATGTTNEIHGYVLFYARTVPTSAAGGGGPGTGISAYADGQLIQDSTGANVSVGQSSLGFTVSFQYDGDGDGVPDNRVGLWTGAGTVVANQWTLGQFYTSLGMLWMRVCANGVVGPWIGQDINTTAVGGSNTSFCDNTGGSADVLTVGDDPFSGVRFDGKILSVGGKGGSVPTQAAFDGMGAWLQARYPSTNLGFSNDQGIQQKAAPVGRAPMGRGPIRHFVSDRRPRVVTQQPFNAQGVPQVNPARSGGPKGSGPIRHFRPTPLGQLPTAGDPFKAVGSFPTNNTYGGPNADGPRRRFVATQAFQANDPGAVLAGIDGVTFGQSGALLGAGALSGTDGIALGQTGTLSGVGALAGTAAISFSQSSTLAGDLPASGSTAITFGQSATLVGSIPANGSTAITFAQTGALAGAGALSGSTPTTFAQSGTLAGVGALAGTDGIAFGQSGTLYIFTALGIATAGAAVGRSPGSAGPIRRFRRTASYAAPQGPIFGSAAVSFGQSGALIGTGALSGSDGIVFGQNATCVGAGSLAGACAAVFGQSATCVGAAAISGNGGIAFGQSATCSGLLMASGSCSATFGQSGTLRGIANAAGSCAILVGQSGSLLGVGRLAGSSAFALTCAGSPSALVSASGTCSMLLSASGTLAAAVSYLVSGLGSRRDAMCVTTPRRADVSTGHREAIGSNEPRLSEVTPGHRDADTDNTPRKVQ